MNLPSIYPAIARHSILLFAVLICMKSQAQEETKPGTVNVTKVTIVNPGISQEIKTGKRQTLYGQLFMNTSAAVDLKLLSGSESPEIDFYFDPAATVQYRHYYNGAKRSRKGRRTEMNSMNYISAVAETFFSKIPLDGGEVRENRRFVTKLGAAWGMQRNYKGRFSIDFYLGAGCRFAQLTRFAHPQNRQISTAELVLMSQLNIGIWLNKKKQ